MRTRDNDTTPDPGARRDTLRDPLGTAAGRAEDPQAPASSSAAMNRTAPIPIDVVLRKLVQSTPDVPNSLEPGITYQGTHAPAAAHAPAVGDGLEGPRVVVRTETFPGPAPAALPRVDDGSSPRLEVTTVVPSRRPASPAWLVAAVVGALVALCVGSVLVVRARATATDARGTASVVSAAGAPSVSSSGAAAGSAMLVAAPLPIVSVAAAVPVPSESAATIAGGAPATAVAPSPPEAQVAPPPTVSAASPSTSAPSPRANPVRAPRPGPPPTAATANPDAPRSSLIKQAPL